MRQAPPWLLDYIADVQRMSAIEREHLRQANSPAAFVQAFFPPGEIHVSNNETRSAAITDKPVEALWNSFKAIAVPHNASAAQVEDMHRCFFAGAATLFSLVMTMLDSSEEPSSADLAKMDRIHAELTAFGKCLDTVKQPEFGWLIENGKDAGDLRYRTMRRGNIEWTADHLEALRFARREDAERFAEEDEDAWRIVEHGWHDMPRDSVRQTVEDARAALGDASVLLKEAEDRIAGLTAELEGRGSGMSLIAAERARQVSVECWTPEHDAEHGAEALQLAGAAYACYEVFPDWAKKMWPFDEPIKPKDTLRNLARAGALIAAAIDTFVGKAG